MLNGIKSLTEVAISTISSVKQILLHDIYQSNMSVYTCNTVVVLVVTAPGWEITGWSYPYCCGGDD